MHEHSCGLYILRSLWVTVWRWENNFPDILSSHVKMHLHAHVQEKPTCMLLGAGCFFSYSQLQFLCILLCVEAASWAFQSLETDLQYKLLAVTMFSYFDYSVGVRNASLQFRTTCQLLALLPSCRCNAMYHSHFLCSIGYAVIKNKKAKPNQSTATSTFTF